MFRGGRWGRLSTDGLVPGDIVSLCKNQLVVAKFKVLIFVFNQVVVVKVTLCPAIFYWFEVPVSLMSQC